MHFVTALRQKISTVTVLATAAVTIGLSAFPGLSAALVANPTPTAKVSFTFDDGQASSYTQAAPTLAKHGLSGTNYVITGCVGMTKVPNTCRANNDVSYMTWAQIQALQNTYHWEIGSHSVDHDCLASNAKADPSDCQTTTLTAAQLETEMSSSKSALTSHGLKATDFAPPFGDYSNLVMAKVAKYYASMRGFKEQGTNQWPLDDYLLNNVTVQEKTTTVTTLEAKIDAAIASNTWLVLTFHDIEPTPSQKADDYQYGTAELDKLAAYVQAKQAAGLIKSVNVNQGLVTSDTNMFANGSFNDGIADGWTTDAPAAITKDTAGNGSYPDPTNSIKLVSGSAASHLFSPQVAVSPTATYMFKNFLNVSTLTSGEVGFYVDEYDVNGNWISGQYLKRENSAFVEDMNFAYKPSSVRVAKASLQVIVAGTGISAYLDNSQMFALSDAAVAQTNLMTNGSFDNGIADGWTTDASSYITPDNATHGDPNSTPATSVKLTAGSSNAHLFSPQMSLTAGKTYTVASHLNIQSLTANEVGFYMDEYDANGNWISGQYITGDHTVGANDITFNYTPSSLNVAKASLQVIVVGNSGITAYIDNVRWYQN